MDIDRTEAARQMVAEIIANAELTDLPAARRQLVIDMLQTRAEWFIKSAMSDLAYVMQISKTDRFPALGIEISEPNDAIQGSVALMTDTEALVDRMHAESVRVGEQLVAFADTEDTTALSVLSGLCALLVGHFLYQKSTAAQVWFVDGFNSMLDGSHVRYRLTHLGGDA